MRSVRPRLQRLMYPGNESLSDDIRERILETFRQTLELAANGNLQEAQLGCDFVLRLDPLFEPARTLNARLQEEGPIEVDDLREFVPAPEAKPPAETEVEPEPASTTTEEPGEAAPAGEAPPEAAAPAEAAEPTGEATEEPSAALDSESERRIQELLDEGQAAFEKVAYQPAIDAWSRIFLIDIDHAEASRRIELARKLKAEVERKVEASLHEGITHLESGAYDEARKELHKVLELFPEHRPALEQMERLDRLEAGETVEEPAATPEVVAPPEEGPPPAVPPLPDDEPEEAPAEEAAEPKTRRPAAGPAPRRAAKAQPDTRRRLFLMIGAAVLLVVAVAGWLLVSNWDRMFPNAAEPVTQVQRPDPIARAQRLHEDGRTSVAVAQLRRLPPDHESYAEAQALIAQWETSREAAEDAGPDEDQLAVFESLVADAGAAFDDSSYRVAAALLTRAATIAPLDESATQQLTMAQERLTPLAAQLELFAQGDWEFALRDLWRMYQDAPRDRVIRDLMVDCYYNLGVRDLQRGDTLSAESQFKEAFELLPDDAELERLVAFSKTYQERPDDLLYRIFVKYLHFR